MYNNLVYVCKHGTGQVREDLLHQNGTWPIDRRSHKRYKYKNKRRETLCRRCDSTRQDCKASERLCGIQWTVRWAGGGHAGRRLTTIFNELNLFLFRHLLLWNSSSWGFVSGNKRDTGFCPKGWSAPRLEVRVGEFDAGLLFAYLSVGDGRRPYCLLINKPSTKESRLHTALSNHDN